VTPASYQRNVRQGFFEQDQFERVLKHLPEDLRPVVTFAFITGWRIKSEVLPLEWHQVDFTGGTVRLEPGLALFASTTQEVVRAAACPVLTVRTATAS
jgi:integrase